MLNRGHTGCGGVSNTGGAVTMCGHMTAVFRGAFHNPGEGVFIKLRERRCGTRSEIATSRHHLDEVRAFFDLTFQHMECSVERLSFATPEVIVPFDGGDRLAGTYEARSGDFSSQNAVTYVQLIPGTTAEVTSGGDAGPNHGIAAPCHQRQQLFRCFLALIEGVTDLRIEAKMHMSIDQSWQQRTPFARLYLCSLTKTVCGPERNDLPRFDTDGIGELEITLVHTISDANVGQRQRASHQSRFQRIWNSISSSSSVRSCSML